MQLFFIVDVLKNSVIITGKHLCWSLFLIKLATGLKTGCFIQKETLPQLLSCEYHEIFKNSFLHGTTSVAMLLRMAEFLRTSILIRGICTEEFMRNSSLCLNLSEICINFLKLKIQIKTM